MSRIEKTLEKIARFQSRHYKFLSLVVLAITIFMIIGVPKVQMESDMSNMMPQEMDVYKLNDRVTDKFGGQDVVLILITLDESSNLKDGPKDIRDESIINYIAKLSRSITSESSIESVTSFTSVLENAVDVTNLDSNMINYLLKQSPELTQFFSDDYKSTFLMIKSDIGSSEEKVNAITDLIESKIESFSRPAGTKIMITGTPPMRVTIMNILFSDATFTLLLACLLIFVMLIILERSLAKTILIFTPLAIGLIWTLGTMGWIGLNISIATAGLGAMILGLGLEYGVFMFTRFSEEREKGKDEEESMATSVPSVGSAILGSGLTTTAGFLALTLSVLPMLQKLGLSLAIGIIFCLISAIFVAPVMILVIEHMIEKIDKKILCLFKKRVEGHKHGKC
ncbi:MMPL family transporter [Candidatus Woesearchaeota archaeon]|nr:MMPL family transporter [Candidatus Woesearchaeota archaeon]